MDSMIKADPRVDKAQQTRLATAKMTSAKRKIIVGREYRLAKMRFAGSQHIQA